MEPKTTHADTEINTGGNSLHVLVGVDDSTESRDAMAAAYELFGGDSRYTIITVHQSPPLVVGMMGAGTTVAGMHHRLDESILEHVAESAVSGIRDVAPDDADLTFRTEVGHAGSAICEIATEEQADVIVIGSRDRGFLDRVFTPSVAKHLVDHAPCPVLVVR
ncbi:MAG: universal stress protein [Ilumatobacter sp.]|uniref:universal stress protein n=1 Tax=Ilumatobacter sp. TaxID=1967498 RepID=UPI003C79617C